jgi:hypothetical protein
MLMSKPRFLFFTIIVLSQNLFAQDTIHLKHTPDTIHLKRSVNDIIITDRPPQAVFAELFGRSIDFSLNYDRRFSNRVDGWGFSVGLGDVSDDNIDSRNYFSIPVSVNYLVGKNGKYLEVGGGLTYFNANITDGAGANGEGNSVVGTFTVGYRNQPVKGGFMFRAGINPMIFSNNFVPFLPYVSFGYDF